MHLLERSLEGFRFLGIGDLILPGLIGQDQVIIMWPSPDEKWLMCSSEIGVLTVQFHNRSLSVTEDIEIFRNYMTALLSHHQYLCFSPMDSTSKAMIISWPCSVSGFQLQIQCPLVKVSWKTVNHYGWLTKKILVSWIVIRT